MPRVRYKGFVKKLKGSTVFSFKQVESKLGRSYAKLLIHQLIKKGEAVRLLKGWYSFKNSPYLVTIPLGKAYVGLGSAAFLHGVWNQVPNICILSPKASSSVRGGMRIVAGHKVMIRKISEKMYFGFDLMHLEDVDEWIRISDLEKTLIDLIYFDYVFTDEIVPAIIKSVDLNKLKEYLSVMERKKVRGFRKISSFLSIP